MGYSNSTRNLCCWRLRGNPIDTEFTAQLTFFSFYDEACNYFSSSSLHFIVFKLLDVQSHRYVYADCPCHASLSKHSSGEAELMRLFYGLDGAVVQDSHVINTELSPNSTVTSSSVGSTS